MHKLREYQSNFVEESDWRYRQELTAPDYHEKEDPDLFWDVLDVDLAYFYIA